MDVVRVDERETRNGDLCYFLHVRDADGLKFSVVCWHSQWEEVRESVAVGEKATLDVKVPAEGYQSFRLG